LYTQEWKPKFATKKSDGSFTFKNSFSSYTKNDKGYPVRFKKLKLNDTATEITTPGNFWDDVTIPVQVPFDISFWDTTVVGNSNAYISVNGAFGPFDAGVPYAVPPSLPRSDPSVWVFPFWADILDDGSVPEQGIFASTLNVEEGVEDETEEGETGKNTYSLQFKVTDYWTTDRTVILYSFILTAFQDKPGYFEVRYQHISRDFPISEPVNGYHFIVGGEDLDRKFI
jgi:hypothetical protein